MSVRDEAARNRRLENFRVQVEAPVDPEFSGELTVRFTTNGFQWNAIGLLREEAEELCKAITLALGK